MSKHHPIVHIVSILDNWDHATEKTKAAVLRLEHDLAGGVHDALFDETSLLHQGDITDLPPAEEATGE